MQYTGSFAHLQVNAFSISIEKMKKLTSEILLKILQKDFDAIITIFARKQALKELIPAGKTSNLFYIHAAIIF